MSLQDANDADLVKYYVDLRDYLEADEAANVQRRKPHQESMQLIENELQRRLIERGSDSTKTEFGTAYESEIMKPSIADKGAFIDWAVHTGLIIDQTLQPKKETVKTYMDEHNGEIPPGVNVAFVRKINVRRS